MDKQFSDIKNFVRENVKIKGFPEIKTLSRIIVKPGEDSFKISTRGCHIAIIKKKGFGILKNPSNMNSGKLLDIIDHINPCDYREFILTCENGAGAKDLEVVLVWLKE